MIAFEAEAASVRVRRIRLEATGALNLAGVDKRVEELAGSLRRFRPLLESTETAPLDELLNLRQELRRLSFQLRKLQDNLTPKSRTVEAQREELLKMEQLWRNTLAALSLQETPPETRQLVIAVQSDIQSVLKMIATSRPSLLTLQGRISEHRIALGKLEVQTESGISEAKARLLSINSEPLWKAVATATISSSMIKSYRDFYQRRALPLSDYLRDEKLRPWVHLLIFVLLSLLFSTVSKKSREWFDSQDDGGNAAQVLRRPVAAAALLSLLLSFYVYPNAPIILYRLPLLLLVIPLHRLLSATPARNERKIFSFLTIIYLLQRLDELVALHDFLHRMLLLVLTSTAVLGVYLALKEDRRTSAAERGLWQSTRMHWVRFSGLILLASVIANIVGSVDLSTLLADACVSSTFAGAALFLGVLTVEGYLIALLRSPLARLSPAIRNNRELVQRRASSIVRLAALTIWAWTTLTLFGLSGPIVAMVTPLLGRQWSFGHLTFSLRGILLFIITIWLSAMAARFAGFLIEEDILTRVTLPQGVPATISMLVRYMVLGVGFVLALTGAGFEWGQIVLVAGAIGVGVGLGLQNLVSSFVAGLILIFERPIRVGDAVEVGNITGVVTRISLRSSRIQTYDGSEVICPNSNLISRDLVNWTLSSQIRRIEVQVGAAYGSNPETVIGILTTIARNHPGVLRTPEPVALFRGFGDSSLNFALRCFSSFTDWLALSSDLGIRINEAFREAGIEIPFPQRDIRITSEASPSANNTNQLTRTGGSP
jgi:small-conductance mechanosensitive channel